MYWGFSQMFRILLSPVENNGCEWGRQHQEGSKEKYKEGDLLLMITAMYKNN